MYNSGMYTGLQYELYDIEEAQGYIGVDRADQFVNAMTQANRADNIVSIFMFPTAFRPWTGAQGVYMVKIRERMGRSDTLDTYIPRNNKLHTYPYHFVCVDTLSDAKNYHFERSKVLDSNNKPVIEIEMTMALTPNPEVVCAPISYGYAFATDGNQLNPDMPNYTESVVVTGFPQCSYAIDAYRAWLAQRGNGANQTISVVSSLLSAGAATLLGGPIGATAGILGAGVSITKTLNEQAIASTLGSKSRGNQGGSSILGNRYLGAYFKEMSLNREMARVIDNFFDRYGYNTQLIKVPNRAVRPYWTYTKTSDASIHGNLPAEAIQKLKSIYNNGITFWKKNADIGDYTQDNRVVTTP